MITKIRLTSQTYSIINPMYLLEEHSWSSENKIMGLYGRNGSGKSYLFEILCGIKTSLSTKIQYQSHDQEWKALSTQSIKYLPQYNFIPQHFKLHEILKDWKISPQQFKMDCPMFANKLELKFSVFSGGERRLIEIYLVLHSNAQLILLDEPFSQLAPIQVEQVLIWIKNTSSFMLITDHNYSEVFELSQQHLYLKEKHELLLFKDLEELSNLGYLTPSSFKVLS